MQNSRRFCLYRREEPADQLTGQAKANASDWIHGGRPSDARIGAEAVAAFKAS